MSMDIGDSQVPIFLASFTLLLQILEAFLHKSITHLVFTNTSANFGVECKEK